jgi:hypothetical protein
MSAFHNSVAFIFIKLRDGSQEAGVEHSFFRLNDVMSAEFLAWSCCHDIRILHYVRIKMKSINTKIGSDRAKI